MTDAAARTVPPDAEGRPRARFGGLYVAQFLGAFNDNAFKQILALLGIAALEIAYAGDRAAFETAAQARTTWTFVVFTLPLLALSFVSAWLVDRIDKRRVLVAMKAVELVILSVGAVALWIEPGGGTFALVLLALMGAQSALFSPAKYGIVPEVAAASEVVAVNSRLESWTFAAIVLGSVAGGLLLDGTRFYGDGGATWLTAAGLASLSLVGLVAIRRVPSVPPACAPDHRLGLFASTGAAWRAIRADRVLWLAVAGSMFFWGVGSLFAQDVFVYARTTLGLSDTQSGIPIAASVVGIGVGAWLVGKLSGYRVELGWIPLGVLGMAAAAFGLGLFAPGFNGTLLWISLLGVASGVVLVPLNALLQLRAPAERRGAVIAVANALAYGGILIGNLGCHGLAQLGASASQIFLGAGAITLVGVAWALWLLPEAALRLALVLLTHTFYRVRVHGAGAVPREGGALIVCNHVSFVDGLLLMAALDRPVRFVVDETYYRIRVLEPLMRLLGFVPISRSSNPRDLIRSVREAGEHLANGELVCIFAEGEISRSGQMLPFQRGYQRIIRGHDVPIVPAHLDRLWGSVFSYADGKKPLRKLPKRLPYRVSVSFGEPLAADTPPADVRHAVCELEASAWCRRIDDARPLHARFVRLARTRPWRLVAADPRVEAMSRIGLLAAAVALTRRLRAPWSGAERVGVMLPPSVPAAALALGASLAGRAIVNLNYTAGDDGLASACRQSGLTHVVTSRDFLAKVGVELPAGVEAIWIEDVKASIGRFERFGAFVRALLWPCRWLERACGATRRVEAADPATVIFSSGSTGEPKGVVLSHFNLAVNGDAATQALPISDADRLLGILPLFHSFGTMGLWFALRNGMSVVFHPNPADATAVGELVERHGLTMLVATPTFLQLYVRRCTPGQFGSLRLVVAGAEKLPEGTARAFEERFGIRPLEGYGATECAPVVAVNSPGYRAPGYYQNGSRPGTVGRPLPGVVVRVVDVDTGRPVTLGESGMLHVRGPNVMQGYLGREDLDALSLLPGGWYVTGDVARVDEDGYVTITDRLARFSKIGGEMVPHGRIETALHEAVGRDDVQVFAVTGIPDERKGERLAVVHTLSPDRVESVLSALAGRGLPNLYIPRADAFVRVDALPLLGTGKLDLRAVRRIAMDALLGDGIASR